VTRWLAALVAVLVVLAVPHPAAAEEPTVERVLILSLPDVTWERLADARADGVELPNLDALLDRSALANLVTRGVGRNPTPGAAYLTISSGTRSIGVDEVDGEVLGVDEDFGADRAGDVFSRRTGEPAGTGGVVVGMPELVEANDDESYEAELGLLATTLDEAGILHAVIANADGAEGGDEDPTHREAALALTDEVGRVAGAVFDQLLVEEPLAPYGQVLDREAVVDRFGEAWDEGGVVLVEASDLARAGRYRELAAPDQADRLWEQALADADALVGELLERVDPEADAVLLLSPFHAEGEPTLTVAALQAPGVEPRLLESALTHRAGYVTLTDVAPTVFDLLDLDQPDGMEGRPMREAGSTRSTATRGNDLATAAARAHFRDLVSRPVSVAIAVYVSVVAAALLLLDVRRWRVPAELTGLAGLGFLLATHLAGLLPFEDWGVPAYWVSLVAAAVVLAGVTWLVGRRDRELTPLLVGAGLLWLVLVVDLVLGAPLQLDTALGYSATVAFRFSGMGNFGFAELAGSAILLAGLLVHRDPWGRGRVLAVGTLLIALAADGLPSMGADVGGVLSATPTFLLLVLLLFHWKVEWRRVLLLGVITLVLISVLAAFDLSRPSDERTHLGRLIERIGDEGWDPLVSVISRKLDGVAASLATPWAVATVVALVAVALLVVFQREVLRSVAAAVPEAGPVAIALLVGGALGAVVNDSGVAVSAVMYHVLAAAAIYTLAGAPRELASVGDGRRDELTPVRGGQGRGGSSAGGSPSSSRG
jgi:hypothetical protein